MNFREFIKKLMIPYIDINRYKEDNPDIGQQCSQHFLNYGFDEARPAYFFKQQDKSELVPAIEIQHLRSNNLPRVSMITEYFNGTPSPCSYIRLIFPLQYLDFLNEINLDEDASSGMIWALNRVPNFASDFDGWLESLRPRDRILYDLDDDLISHYGQFSDQSKIIISLLLLADRVTVSTSSLYKIISGFNKNTIIRNNFCLLDLTAKESDFKKECSILYMGTSTHSEDFKLIYGAILSIARKYNDIKFNIIGLDEIPKLDLINNINISISYYPQFIQKYRKISNYKIGIIPLVDNSINRSKSNMKYYDYLNKCEYILCSNVGQYEDLKLPRLRVVRGNDEAAWINEIEKLIASPSINQEEINKSFFDARNVKFRELENLANVINSMYFSKNEKIIDYNEFNFLLTDLELYNLFRKRFSYGRESKLSYLNEFDNLFMMINNIDYFQIDDLINLKIPLSEIFDFISSMKRDFVLEINVLKSHYHEMPRSPDSLYMLNFNYLMDPSKKSISKSLTNIKLKDLDVLFICF